MMSNTTNATFQEIAEVIRKRDNFLILSHMRPDGDAIGCQLAMAHCLSQLGKNFTVWNEDGMPEKFAFLQGAEMVAQPPAEGKQEFDVVLALDTATYKRLGTPLEHIAGNPYWVNIDHHVTNERYGDLVYISSNSPAAGEILYELFRATDLPITYAAADALYAAISTDTGSFQYPSTTARTYEIGAELVRAGVNVGEINRLIYDSYPLRRVKLLSEVLNQLDLRAENRLASFVLTQEAFHSTGAIAEDTEGLIDHIRAIDSVIVAALFEELPGGRVRISMRSKDPRVSVSDLAARFGGGGHHLAAGARAAGTVTEVRAKVLEAAEKAIRAALG